MILSKTLTKPFGAVGGFFAMALDTFTLMFKPPFAWREFLLQSWFVARVSLIPTLMLAIPFTVLTVFMLNILQVAFFSKTIGEIRNAFRHYNIEIIRLIAEMSLGTGALAVIGGTIVIVGFLTLTAGAIIAVQGYNQLGSIGVEALTWQSMLVPRDP